MPHLKTGNLRDLLEWVGQRMKVSANHGWTLNAHERNRATETDAMILAVLQILRKHARPWFHEVVEKR